MASVGLGEGAVEQVQAISGGTQNQMTRFRRGGTDYVARRPPRHPRLQSNRALLRDMRVLTALAATDVPTPVFVAACEDPEVLGGSVFYVMEVVDGFNCTVSLPTLHAGSPHVRRAMGFSAVEAAATMARVDIDGVGLTDFGAPEGFLDRQVTLWTSSSPAMRRRRVMPWRACPVSTHSQTGWNEIRHKQPSPG
jgi:aminoglycoside phosphotransferase (APT) family kinase protein